MRALAIAKLPFKCFEYKLRGIAVDNRRCAASVYDLLAVVEALYANVARVPLVDHDPGFTDPAHYFDSAIAHMPRSALAKVSLDAKPWAAIGQGRAVCTSFDLPKHALA